MVGTIDLAIQMDRKKIVAASARLSLHIPNSQPLSASRLSIRKHNRMNTIDDNLQTHPSAAHAKCDALALIASSTSETTTCHRQQRSRSPSWAAVLPV